MKIHPRVVLLPASVLLAALTPACALHPPVQNSGAAIAVQPGVQVAVVGQSCDQTVEPDLQGADLVEATVEVQVRNAGATPLTIHREAFDLRAPDGEAIPTSTWCASDPLSVDAGQSRTFQLRFMSRGGLSCTQPMQLESPAAITAGAAPIGIGAITFIPRA